MSAGIRKLNRRRKAKFHRINWATKKIKVECRIVHYTQPGLIEKISDQITEGLIRMGEAIYGEQKE